MIKLLILSAVFSGSCLAGVFNFTGGNLKSNNSDGKFYSIEARHQVNKKLELGPSYESLNRYFNNSTVELADSQIGLASAYKIDKTKYIEGRVTHSSKYSFLPKMSYMIQPHYIFMGFDIWVGLRFSDYPRSDVKELRVGVLKELPFHMLGAQVFIIDSVVNALSYHVFHIYNRDVLETRIDLSHGKGLEDDAIVASFSSVNIEVLYDLNSFKIGPGYTHYDGDIREETRIYLKTIIDY